MTPSTPPGDWEAGEDTRLERIDKAFSYVPLNLYDEITKLGEAALGEYIAEIARLREREAQLEREVQDYRERVWDGTTVQLEHRAEAAEARVKELEAALREIADGKTALPHEVVAARALAREEET